MEIILEFFFFNFIQLRKLSEIDFDNLKTCLKNSQNS